MSRRMDCVVSDSLGGVLPNQVYATLEIRAWFHTNAPLQGRSIYSNSRVHDNTTLYAEAKPYHYKLYLYLLVSSFSSSRGCRGRKLGGIVNCYYNLLLYNVAATSAALLLSFLLI